MRFRRSKNSDPHIALARLLVDQIEAGNYRVTGVDQHQWIVATVSYVAENVAIKAKQSGPPEVLLTVELRQVGPSTKVEKERGPNVYQRWQLRRAGVEIDT
jgi:hypothetical protein